MAAAVIFFFFEGGGILTSTNDNPTVKENHRHKSGELKKLGLTLKPFTDTERARSCDFALSVLIHLIRWFSQLLIFSAKSEDTDARRESREISYCGPQSKPTYRND